MGLHTHLQQRYWQTLSILSPVLGEDRVLQALDPEVRGERLKNPQHFPGQLC